MKTLKNLLFLSVLFLCAGAFGQTVLLTTTLSAAMPGMGSVSGATPTGNMAIASVASATGVLAPTPNTSYTTEQLATSEAQVYLFVDRELMQVKGVSGTTVTVIRGMGSTSATAHISGALVFIVPATVFGAWSGGGYLQGSPSVPSGACTRTAELYLPRIQFTSGTFADCVGGQWVVGDSTMSTRNIFHYMTFPTIGNVTAAAALGTSTATTAAVLYCTEIDLPYSKLVTGIAAHIGATGATDKWIMALYDSSGALLANSAVAGLTVGSAFAWQATALTAPYYAVGPGQYYGCVQSNGTTATLDLLTTAINAQEYTFKSGVGTFGTLPNFTAPTQFTTLQGPYLYLY